MQQKRIISLILVLVMCVTLPITATASDAGYSNYKNHHDYNNKFHDVKESAWHHTYVRQAYERGLVNGKTATEFCPDDHLSIAETITLAARLHCIYETGAEIDAAIPAGGKWYDPYVNYALENGIISAAHPDYTAAATRSEVAVIFAKSLPEGAFDSLRTVSDGTIPDVAMNAAYSGAVYKLYRAGVLSGNDDKGTFTPNASIKRSEIAAICVRIADPSQRSSAGIGTAVNEGDVLTAVEIAEKCSPAVFYIEIYAFNGELCGRGSGFFISADGLAVTNYHVAENSSKLTAMTPDGKVYDDVKIIDCDEVNDLALLKISGSGFAYLEMGDSSTIKQGQTVYALGSPKGLDNSFSTGVIANVKRELDGIAYIQMTADITSGSSGGALINEYGKVIGVNTAIHNVSGANLNLAVPINIAKQLDTASTKSLVCYGSDFYSGYNQALDFGVFSGVALADVEYTLLSETYYYDAFDFVDAEHFSHTMYYYQSALLSYGFTMLGESIFDEVCVFMSDTEMVAVSIDLTNTKTIAVLVSSAPVYYEEFYTIVDFGAYTKIPLTSGPTLVDGSMVYTYKWRTVRSASDIEIIVMLYAYYMESAGFELVYTNGSNVYLLESIIFSVAVMIDEWNVYIDIAPIKS